MILTIPINPEMRIRLAYAEAIKLDISGHPELAELEADLVAAHAHIEHLHGLIKKYNLTRKITEVVSAWEESQCQL
ncbi:hypothetical protein [Shewanella baltica]|uniref:hypothetical protein n=1 Tax=Shewanella TaxID=22 RepID=UPI00217D1FA0|nr:hypothetical protein [Shewanella baltica]MCS6102340.1 hypothetical protein [Shewanella baltica]MCS6185526.1 hypothetical protein [Shewanella baltica]